MLSTLAARAAECTYPRKPINWIMRYCAMKVETDDEMVIQDSSCFRAAKNDINTTEPCKMKEKYKTMICDEFMMEAHKFKSKHDCLADTDITPFVSG
jgi:hypothetical protein